MSDKKYYIAKDNFSFVIDDGSTIEIYIGNQFVLIEDLHNETLKLNLIDSDMPDNNQIFILPSNILEDMSNPSPNKPNPIIRSQSTIKERICSLNLNDKINDTQSKLKYSTFAHGSLPKGVSRSMVDSDRSRKANSMAVTSIISRTPNKTVSDSAKDPDVAIMTKCEGESKWKCVRENDKDVYVHIESGDRWHSAVDDVGRQYYYSELSQQSAWALPGNEISTELSFGEEAVRPIEEALEGMVGSSDSDVSFEEDFEGSVVKEKSDDGVFVSHGPSTIEVFPDNEPRDSNFSLKHMKKEYISGPLFNKILRTERSGPAEKTKFSENGKEVTRKWSTSHTVLTGPELLFYKDKNAMSVKPGMPQGKVELKLKIQNLEFSERVEPNNKSVMLQIEDTGAPGSCITYLLRYSSTDDMRGWKAALQYAKNWQNENRYSDHACKVDQVATDEVSADKQNIGNKLKLLLKKRPTRESLEARGILKLESVFGSTLEVLCEHEKRKVPEFVFRCILAIEARGLQHNGIYRVSGNQAKIQKLRLGVDENKYQLNSESIELETLTGALKSFFKELKEPLFDEEFCNKMIDMLSRKSEKKNPYREVNMNSVKKLLSKLKSTHYETAKALFGHLHKVAALANKNRMDISNLAMVWGPNLYQVVGQATTKLAMVFMTHNQIVDYLLTFYSQLFENT